MTVLPPDPGRPQWSDWVQAELFERRTVMITGPLDDDSVARIAAQLMTLDAMGDDAVHLHVDSGGGTLDAAVAIVDVLDLLGVPVHAHCYGRAEGPAMAVLAVADRRVASPHSRLRLQEPPDEFRGRAAELEAWSERRTHQLRQLHERLARAAQKPVDVIAEAMDEGRFLTPPEAIELGLLDEVATPLAEVHHLRRHVGFRPQ